MISNIDNGNRVESFEVRNIWNSFTKKQLCSINDYYLTFFLLSQGFSNKEIHEKWNISLDCISAWKNHYRIPYAVRILEEFEERYSIDFFEDELLTLSYLVGYNLGDGNISRNFCNTWFYGVYNDLIKMKKLFDLFNVNPVVYNYKIDNAKMAVHDRIFSRLLFCFGAISGDKTISSFEVPNWIINFKNEKIKIKFLQGLFDSELSCLSEVRDNSYTHLTFSQSKRIDLVDDGIKYMNQIRNLLFQFGITTSLVKKDRIYFRNRDSSTMQELCFYIHSNSINLDKFISKINFLHNSKRCFITKINSENIKKNSITELKDLELYPQVLKLREQGFSAYKIAKITHLPIRKAKYWAYKNGKPRAFYFSNKI